MTLHGVLTHLNSLDEVEIAIQELSRVTKYGGGYIYITSGGLGGVLGDAIFPAVRDYYRENEEFRRFIDSIKPEDFHCAINLIKENMEKHSGETFDINDAKILFDLDLCISLQNLIQVPVRLSIEEEFIQKLFDENKIKNVKRLRRFVKRRNIRKFLSPLHYEIDHPISKILFGTGIVELLGKK